MSTIFNIYKSKEGDIAAEKDFFLVTFCHVALISLLKHCLSVPCRENNSEACGQIRKRFHCKNVV